MLELIAYLSEECGTGHPVQCAKRAGWQPPERIRPARAGTNGFPGTIALKIISHGATEKFGENARARLGRYTARGSTTLFSDVLRGSACWVPIGYCAAPEHDSGPE